MLNITCVLQGSRLVRSGTGESARRLWREGEGGAEPGQRGHGEDEEGGRQEQRPLSPPLLAKPTGMQRVLKAKALEMELGGQLEEKRGFVRYPEGGRLRPPPPP